MTFLLKCTVTYANVVSTLALFLAMGGTAYAALVITGSNVKDESLTGRDIRNGSIRSRDISNRSILARDLSSSTRAWIKGHAGADGIDGVDGADGIDGVDGDNGADGADGADGAQGPAGIATAQIASSAEDGNPGSIADHNYATVTSLTLGAGNWIILGKSWARALSTPYATVTCRLYDGTSTLDETAADFDTDSGIELMSATSLSAQTTISLQCRDDTTGANLKQTKLIAMQATDLTAP